MKQIARILFMALAPLALAACYVVSTPEPLGETPVALDPAEWDGVWGYKDGAVHVKTRDAAAGFLCAAQVEFHDGAPTLTSTLLYVRETGDLLFASMAEEPENAASAPGAKRYLWGVLKKDGDTAILWGPDHEAFGRFVTGKRLPGALEDKNVRLEKLNSEQQNLIAGAAAGELFAWREPAVFTRVSKK